MKNTSQLVDYVGGFHSILLHRTTLDGQLYAYYRFVLCGSEQILLNCIYVLPNTRSIAIIDN